MRYHHMPSLLYDLLQSHGSRDFSTRDKHQINDDNYQILYKFQTKNIKLPAEPAVKKAHYSPLTKAIKRTIPIIKYIFINLSE